MVLFASQNEKKTQVQEAELRRHQQSLLSSVDLRAFHLREEKRLTLETPLDEASWL